jgi:hypothetical protein
LKRRRVALSVPWRAHKCAWRACPPCVLLLLTPPPLRLLLPTTARQCPWEVGAVVGVDAK